MSREETNGFALIVRRNKKEKKIENQQNLYLSLA